MCVNVVRREKGGNRGPLTIAGLRSRRVAGSYIESETLYKNSKLPKFSCRDDFWF